VRSVREKLGEVNHYLQSLSQRETNPTVIGTTIVALMVRDGAGVCLWAGDSRLYRLRGGALEQLTADHSESNEPDAIPALNSSNVITRALGGHDEVDLEQLTFDVQQGDRLLLCSDGLYREVDGEGLRAILGEGDATTTVRTLLQRTLQGAAMDNVTAVVVDALPSTD
jgi:serine/threonine protein phosphatase Stp1